MELPRLVRDKAGAWNPLICLKWGDDFINLLTSIVTSHPRPEEGEDEPVWRVKFTPTSGVAITLLSKDGMDEVVNGEDRVGFLPRWYFDELSELDSPSRAREASASPIKLTATSLVQKKSSTIPTGWQV